MITIESFVNYRAKLADLRSRNGYHLADLSEYASTPDTLDSAGSVWLKSTVSDVLDRIEEKIGEIVRDITDVAHDESDVEKAEGIRAEIDGIEWSDEISELFSSDFGASPIYTADIYRVFADLALADAFDDYIEEYGTVELDGQYGSDTLSVMWRAIDWTGHDVARHAVDEINDAIERDLEELEA